MTETGPVETDEVGTSAFPVSLSGFLNGVRTYSSESLGTTTPVLKSMSERGGGGGLKPLTKGPEKKRDFSLLFRKSEPLFY